MTGPVSVKLADPTGFAIHVYKEAQKIDPWPGENYEGTSVLAGAQILHRLGYIDSYWWAFGIDQVLHALVHDPVVVGVPWFSDMYSTDERGIVSIGGTLVGGHAICLTGFAPMRVGNVRELYVRWRNSWGAGYGVKGDGWISAANLERLLNQFGEACVLSGQRRVPSPPHVVAG
jgi:hypothetical protein